MKVGAVAARNLAAGAVMVLSSFVPAHADTDVTLQLDMPQYQQTTYWCVSASAAIALAQEGVRVDQATLAAAFHTVVGEGVESTDIEPQLDEFAAPGYSFVEQPDTTSPRALQALLTYDIGKLGQPVIVPLDGAKMPWNSKYAGHGPRWHVEIAYGYNLQDRTVTMWEVWGPTGGTHVVSLDLLASAINPSTGAIEVIK